MFYLNFSVNFWTLLTHCGILAYIYIYIYMYMLHGHVYFLKERVMYIRTTNPKTPRKPPQTPRKILPRKNETPRKESKKDKEKTPPKKTKEKKTKERKDQGATA